MVRGGNRAPFACDCHRVAPESGVFAGNSAPAAGRRASGLHGGDSGAQRAPHDRARREKPAARFGDRGERCVERQDRRELAKAAGAGVVDAPKLLRGMLGKPNACAEGARVLTSRWILFADADTWFQPGFLDSAVAAAEAAKMDFLSVYLRPAYRIAGRARRRSLRDGVVFLRPESAHGSGERI